MNERGFVISWIWTWTVGADERVCQAREMHDRYKEFGIMEEDPESIPQVTGQPVFCLDNCCSDIGWLTGGLWINPHVIGDMHHYGGRIIEAACGNNKTMHSLFSNDLRKACGSSSLGVHLPGETIIENIEALIPTYRICGVWTDKTSAAFETQKKHFLGCLALPTDLCPVIEDRNGKSILIRGTNNAESTWR